MATRNARKSQEKKAMPDVKRIISAIRKVRCSAEDLHRLGDTFPAISKNAARILASVAMLELSVPEIKGFHESEIANDSRKSASSAHLHPEKE